MADPQVQLVNAERVGQFGYKILLKKRTNGSSAQWSFTNYVQRFTIFESIFSKFMYMEGQVMDGGALHDRIGLQAGDILEVNLLKDLDDELTKQVYNEFYIERVSSKVRLPGGKGSSYTFTAVSRVKYRENKAVISRAFNKKASDIVKEVCDVFFDLPPEKCRAENFQETYGDVQYISTYLKPFQLIEYMQRVSIPASSGPLKDSSYFFFETRDGVFYKTLRQMLIDGQEWTYILAVDKTRSSLNTAETDFARIEEHEIKTSNDTRRKVAKGAIENQISTFDPIRRTFTESRFNLKESSRDILLLGENLVMDETELDNLVGEEDRVTDRVLCEFFKCSQRAYDAEEDYVELNHSATAAQLEMINQQVVSIRVPGNPRIKPGDRIIINAQIAGATSERETDVFLSGRYLVGSAAHTVIDAADYGTVFDLYKDGWEINISQYRKDDNSQYLRN